MNRRDFVKAIPAAALVPAALTAQTENAQAGNPQTVKARGRADLPRTKTHVRFWE